LLAIALVRDYVVTRRDRSIVRPFAKVLNPQPLPGDDSATQVSDEAVLSTSTWGSVSDRMASVTFRDTANRTPNVLRVDVSCNCPHVDPRPRDVLGISAAEGPVWARTLGRRHAGHLQRFHLSAERVTQARIRGIRA